MEEFQIANLDYCPGCGNELTDEERLQERIYCEDCEEKHDEMFEL